MKEDSDSPEPSPANRFWPPGRLSLAFTLAVLLFPPTEGGYHQTSFLFIAQGGKIDFPRLLVLVGAAQIIGPLLGSAFAFGRPVQVRRWWFVACILIAAVAFLLANVEWQQNWANSRMRQTEIAELRNEIQTLRGQNEKLAERQRDIFDEVADEEARKKKSASLEDLGFVPDREHSGKSGAKSSTDHLPTTPAPKSRAITFDDIPDDPPLIRTPQKAGATPTPNSTEEAFDPDEYLRTHPAPPPPLKPSGK